MKNAFENSLVYLFFFFLSSGELKFFDNGLKATKLSGLKLLNC